MTRERTTAEREADRSAMHHIGKHPKRRVTKRHRPALWEAMLGTVYAMNDVGDVRYFDYRWRDAIEFAGISDERDPRWMRWDRRFAISDGSQGPKRGQWTLWITRGE